MCLKVDEMLYCFLRSQACRLLLAADYAQNGGGEENLPDKPAPLYVGVTAWTSTAPVFAGHLLALLTGEHLTVNRTQCEDMKEPVSFSESTIGDLDALNFVLRFALRFLVFTATSN